LGKRYKVGIMGGGWVSQNRHIPSIKQDKRCEIVALVDNRKEVATKVADKFNIKNVYTDIDTMLEKETLDVVSICTSPWSHCEYSIKALHSGCHTLVEKPMAMNLKEVESMTIAEENSHKKLSICHNFLFSKSMLKAQQLIDDNKVGKIKNIQALQLGSSRRRLPEWYSKLPGGLFYDESPHILYILKNYLHDLQVTNANAVVDEAKPQKISQIHADVHSSEATGSITMLFDSPLSEWNITIIGEKKVLSIDIFRDILIQLDTDNTHKPTDVLKTSLSAIYQELNGISTTGTRLLMGNLLFGHDIMIRRFIDSIEKDTKPPVTSEDGRQIVKVQHEILQICGIN
jgi:scyllo-inositol 2-dehydrogenase (NADP+)